MVLRDTGSGYPGRKPGFQLVINNLFIHKVPIMKLAERRFYFHFVMTVAC